MKKKRSSCALAACLFILVLSSGCSSVCRWPQWGFVPDEPYYADEKGDGDAEAIARNNYRIKLRWAKDLRKAYSFRAGLNRISNYVAGGVAATGGAAVTSLAALDKSDTDAAKIIPVATGLIAGIFVLVDNDGLAHAYLDACGKINDAISENKPKADERGEYEEATCGLVKTVNDAIIGLGKKRIELSNPPNAVEVKLIETANKLIDKLDESLNKGKNGEGQ